MMTAIGSNNIASTKDSLFPGGIIFGENGITFNKLLDKVITASHDGTAKIWDAATGKTLHTLQHNYMLMSAAFNEQGDKVVTASLDNTVKIWDANTGNLLQNLGHTRGVLSAAFN